MTPTARDADATRRRRDADGDADDRATETPTEEATETPTATTEEPAGTPTATPTAPAGVRFNEVLPNARSVNWDGRGRANAQDEWIELRNPTGRAVDISRWSVEAPGRRLSLTYRFPRGTILPANSYITLFQRDTRLVLDDQGATLRLYNATGALVDTVKYPALRPDASYSRDAAGAWHSDWQPSPGQPNEVTPKLSGSATPAPTETRAP